MVGVRQQENSFGKLHTNDVIEEFFHVSVGYWFAFSAVEYQQIPEERRNYKPKDYVQLRIDFKCNRTELNVVLAVRGPEKSSNECISSYAWT